MNLEGEVAVTLRKWAYLRGIVSAQPTRIVKDDTQ